MGERRHPLCLTDIRSLATPGRSFVTQSQRARGHVLASHSEWGGCYRPSRDCLTCC